MNIKHIARKRRGAKAKKIISKQTDRSRLVVFRSASHIYAQIIKDAKVLVAASTVDKALKSELKGTKVEQAKLVGNLLAKRASENDIKLVSFDRNGYRYHGRVKALADAAREAGLDF